MVKWWLSLLMWWANPVFAGVSPDLIEDFHNPVPNFSRDCLVCVSFYRMTEGIHHFMGARLDAQCRPESDLPNYPSLRRMALPEESDFTFIDMTFGLPQADDVVQFSEILNRRYGTYRWVGTACGEEAERAINIAIGSSHFSLNLVNRSVLDLLTWRLLATPILGRACKVAAEDVEQQLVRAQVFEEQGERSPVSRLSRWFPVPAL